MDILENARKSVNLYMQNFIVLFLATLVASVGSVITLGVISGPLAAGLLVICLKLLRGEKAEIGEVFNHFNKFVPTFLLTVTAIIIMLIISGLSSILGLRGIIQFFVSPFISVVLILAIGFVVEQDMKPADAIKRALECFMTNPVKIWLYSFAVSLLAAVGAILFIIPVIFTMPLGPIAYAMAYRELGEK